MRALANSPDPQHRTRHASRLLCAILGLAPLVLVPQARPQEASPTVSRQPAAQDTRNAQGMTPLVAAASAGDTASVKALLSAGAGIDATDSFGRTALIAAVQKGQGEVALVLIAAGANLNREARFIGSALSVAENNGETRLAASLLASGAHSTGKSVGDTVCVRSWGGDGFCGIVKSFTVRSVQIGVTRLVGCAGGCPAREECSGSNPVGGVNGLHAGEQIAVPSWCLTQTGVKQ